MDVNFVHSIVVDHDFFHLCKCSAIAVFVKERKSITLMNFCRRWTRQINSLLNSIYLETKDGAKVTWKEENL